MQEYKIKKKKAKTDYYISTISVDYEKGRYMAQIDTANRVTGCFARTCLESDNGKVLYEMVRSLCDNFSPAKGTEEIGTFIDFCGLLEGADEENA